MCFTLMSSTIAYQRMKDKFIGGSDIAIAIIPMPNDNTNTNLMMNMFDVTNDMNVKNMDSC